MLRSLDIRDVLIVEKLTLELGPGLNVLTGETGAGKSILLDALGLVLGWRGRADLVRNGATQGEVTAVFDITPDHPAHAVLQELGIDASGGELILRRINTAEGRKTAWVNDRRVSGDMLRQLSETLVELHGQHDDRGLLDPRSHRAVLDAFAGLDLGPCRDAWAQLRRCRHACEQAQESLNRLRQEEDFLRHAIDELDRLSPQEGEEALLDTQRRDMQSAAKITGDIARALALISEEGGAEATMRDAQRWLEGALHHYTGDGLEAPLAALHRGLIELSEAQAGVADFLETLNNDPTELERAEERLFAIRALARKYNVLPDELANYAEQLRQQLIALEGGESNLNHLQNNEAKANKVYQQEVAHLSAERTKAARRLDHAIKEQLGPLKMERAIFKTDITQTDPGPEGADVVTFCVATNPGAPAGPLNRIASGGELSRFLLALKVCLFQQRHGETQPAENITAPLSEQNQRNIPPMTLIFDEIDRGVGGATADAVGRRLRVLSEQSQVLVVTHSPQVAALGDTHWLVSKTVTQDQTLTQAALLSAQDKVEEIARMLSGDTVSDPARQAARALLQAATL